MSKLEAIESKDKKEVKGKGAERERGEEDDREGEHEYF